jgi:hypothetical protein
MPVWERPQYLMERLPQTLFAPELQNTRIMAAQKAWQRDPQEFMDKFVPMFLNGIKSRENNRTGTTASAYSLTKGGFCVDFCSRDIALLRLYIYMRSRNDIKGQLL